MTSVLESIIKNNKEIEKISSSSSCSDILSEDKKRLVRETLTKDSLQEMINKIKERYDTPQINDKYRYLFNIIKCRRELLLQYEKDPSKLSVKRNTKKIDELEELEKKLEKDKKHEEEELHNPVKKSSMLSSVKSVFGFSRKKSPNKGGRRHKRKTQKKIKRSSRK